METVVSLGKYQSINQSAPPHLAAIRTIMFECQSPSPPQHPITAWGQGPASEPTLFSD